MSRAVALFVAALLCIQAASGQPPTGQPDQQRDLAETLLKTSAKDDGMDESAFFRTLAELARRQGQRPSDYTHYDSGEHTRSGRARGGLMEGRAVSVTSEQKQYVVAVLGIGRLSVPGVTAQQVILLDEGGRILDRLACGINTRYGDLATEILDRPATDGAQLVVRFKPLFPDQSTWHNWHTITYGGKPYTFYTEEKNEPVNWLERGLVRAAIKRDKLQVLFPELKQPDGEKAKP
jgi:hypothetical protein